jgi:uncharacterized membrane protein HdeD (DUF308 family)
METLVRNWWALFVRGLLGVAFAVCAWLMPAMTLYVLVLLYGAYAFLDGVFALAAAVRAARQRTRWWPMAVEGLLDLAAGAVCYLVPIAAAFGLLVLVAAWALATGLLEVIAAVRLRRELRGEWLLLLSGLLSLGLGVLLLARPLAGLLALVWLTAGYAFLYGLVLIGLSLRLRHLGRVAARRPPIGATPQPV